MTFEIEKVDFNNLKKCQNYQIRYDKYIRTGTFWEYKQLNDQHLACFFEKDMNYSYPSHYDYYRILSIEEIHAKIKFNVVKKIHYNDLKKGMYKFDKYDASFCFKFGELAIFREMIYDNVYKTTSHNKEMYYMYISEEEYRKKRRDKFNENVLKTILNRLIDGFQWY